MHITNIVDYETESKGDLILIITEPFLDLVDVNAISRNIFALQEGGDVSHGSDGVCGGRVLEVGVVFLGSTIREVWLIDKVPVTLSRVALALDVISEDSSLSEWMQILILSKGRFRGLKVSEH